MMVFFHGNARAAYGNLRSGAWGFRLPSLRGSLNDQDLGPASTQAYGAGSDYVPWLRLVLGRIPTGMEGSWL